MKLTYGKDFHFTVFFTFKDYLKENGNDLKIGNNKLDYEVSLTEMITIYSGICYKMTTISNHELTTEIEVISVTFHKSIPFEDLPVVQVHFTSEMNSYGITRAQWFDGDVSFLQLKSYHKYIELGLREEHYIFLENKLNCRHKPFYICYGSLISEIPPEKCPQKCLPHSIPPGADNGNLLTYCDLESEEMKCMSNQTYEVFHNATAFDICIERACEVIQYEENIVLEEFSNNSYSRSFGYYFLPPQTATVHEEYLIYDFAGILGTIGGTLGMCIGFSFVGLMSIVFDTCETLIEQRKKRY